MLLSLRINASKAKNQADENMTLALTRDRIKQDKVLIYTSGFYQSTYWIDEHTRATSSPLGESHAQVVTQLMKLHK